MRKWLCFFLLWLTLPPAFADILPSDDAFKFKAEAISPNTIKLSWDVADGYFLYKDRFSFNNKSDNAILGAANYPKADVKDPADTSGANTEIYRKQLSIEIPVERSASPNAIELVLESKFQGCADAGMCYPPIIKETPISLAALDNKAQAPAKPETLAANANTQSSAKPSTLLKDIKGTSNAKSDALDADEAFVFTLVAVDKGTLNAHWSIQPDHHLYQPKIKFKVIEPKDAKLGAAIFPKGEQIDDEYFGKIDVYGKDIDVRIPVSGATGDKLVIETQYQGCADKTGICYEPQVKTETLSLAGLPAARSVAVATTEPVVLNEQDKLVQQLEDSTFFGKIAIMFGAGLLLAFTPCIFPMIPILSGIIAGYGGSSSRKAFLLSITYVVAGAFTYAFIGFVFGLFGQNLQTILQHPVTFGLMAALFVALALSMFGFYDLQLPNSLQSRLSEISNKQESGSFIGAAIMGVLSTLIVGPCAGPVLAGALLYIAQTKDYLLGATALFSMGIGLGIPLLLIGTSAGHLLPRAGAWMDTVKAVFGIIMLGIAIMMLDRVVSREITMVSTGILLVASGVYMGALDKINHDVGGWGRFWKSLGMIQLFYGALLLFGVAAGSQNLWQPLKGVFGSSPSNNSITLQAPQTSKLIFKPIHSMADLNNALEEAKKANKPLMLDFYATWCTTCKDMEHKTFADPRVVKALQDAVVVQADVSDSTPEHRDLMKKLSVIGPPTVIFYDKQGQEIKQLRLVGPMPPTQFTEHLNNFFALSNK